jgi:hypothetical protein
VAELVQQDDLLLVPLALRVQLLPLAHRDGPEHLVEQGHLGRVVEPAHHHVVPEHVGVAHLVQLHGHLAQRVDHADHPVHVVGRIQVLEVGQGGLEIRAALALPVAHVHHFEAQADTRLQHPAHLLEQPPDLELVARVLRPVVGVGVHAHARRPQRWAADRIRSQPGRLQRGGRLALVRPLGAAGPARERERQRSQRGRARKLRGHGRYGRRSAPGHQ